MISAKKLAILLIGIILLLTNCNKNDESYNFYGMWQSLNNSGSVIEIDQNHDYTLFVKGKPTSNDIAGFGQLKINIIRKEENWNLFRIEDEATKKKFSAGRIEIVNEDRIRIYYHKHHDILDIADEYHRADNLVSFDKIMSEIQQQPEKEIN